MAWSKPMPARPVVAVAGATGAVGVEMLKCLEELDFPASGVRALASARSAGTKLPFKGGEGRFGAGFAHRRGDVVEKLIGGLVDDRNAAAVDIEDDIKAV